MKRLLVSFGVVSMVMSGLVSCTKAQSHGEILRVSDAARMTLSDIVDDLRRVELVFVGELHNSPAHHKVQLSVIQALKEAGVSLAVGLEMFQSDSQADLNRWIAGGLAEEAFKKIYDENWSSDWSLYRDIFIYARQSSIPMIGLNIPSHISRQVAQGGFASLSPEQVGQLPEVSCRVDETYMAFIRRAFGMHAHTEGKSFTYFCEAQIVWDTAMASNLLRYLKDNPTHTVVVLAGSGHAWKRGIPDQIRQQSDLSYRVILPEIPGRLESEEVTLDDTDYLWVAW